MIAAGRRVKVMPKLKREQGIQAARTIFGKCFFDAGKCADGIQALRHYRYEAYEAHLDPSGKPGLRKEPLHDWASHAADAFRTAAVMIQGPRTQEGAGEAQERLQVIAMELRHRSRMRQSRLSLVQT
jgi:phage terminase large subunit